MNELNELKKEFLALETKIKGALDRFESLSDRVNEFDLSAEEGFSFDLIHQASDHLYDASFLLKPLKSEPLITGVLVQQPNGRYAIVSPEPKDSYEITSGATIEIFVLDDDYRDGGFWEITSIEYDGDYYALFLGKDKALQGLKARVRK